MLYPPPAQVYSPPKKDMSWTGLPEFADDTITNYSRPMPSIDLSKSNTSDLQNSNPSVSKPGESSNSIMSKPMIKIVKAADSPGVIKTNKTKTARKPPVKYAEMKNTENLNTKITKLNKELSDSKTNLYHYKLGLLQVEARLVEFKTQEIKFCEKIRGLERDVEVRNNKIENLMNELEQVKKEK
nr:hypothetical protein [Tanacetum cinerariifolium]